MKNSNKNNPPPSNFIRTIIEKNLAQGLYKDKKWAGGPGDAMHHEASEIDPAKIRTRFPPEPNGYLHIGHAKSIFLNFGLAQDFNGACHLRFDDTNPEKENKEYVNSIIDSVKWLGFDWTFKDQTNLFYASDYFESMYKAAMSLIESGFAYVDKQTSDEIRENRGTLTSPGIDSPWRDYPISNHIEWFKEMKDGQHADGSMILRAKINMASPNINLRDPAIYRIKRSHHHRTGDAWCIYPMYTFAHPIEDALEGITHSICTLEFEDQRPFYDWLLKRLKESGVFSGPLPKQHEFARLNLTYTVLSKRKLIELVEGNHVTGWDDPRMPTLVGARRRGFTPEGFKLFAERIGVSKADSWIDYATLEDSMREVLNVSASRRVAVLDPIKLIINNYPKGHEEDCLAPNHPLNEALGKRALKLTKELWIEREDFMTEPIEKYFRLYPGNQVRLRYGYIVTCTGFDLDDQGSVITVYCDYLPDTKSGTAGANSIKVKGNIHWLSTKYSIDATVNQYDRLFTEEHPGNKTDNYLDDLNLNSLKTSQIIIERSCLSVTPGDQFQFERHGYFICDSNQNSIITFNRTTTLRDTWQ
jgi:glutaminyl-tRNA synthetase